MIRVHYSVDELRSRVARRRMWRRVQTALLTLVVVGATAGGAFAMTRAFRPGTARHPLGGGRGGSAVGGSSPVWGSSRSKGPLSAGCGRTARSSSRSFIAAWPGSSTDLVAAAR